MTENTRRRWLKHAASLITLSLLVVGAATYQQWFPRLLEALSLAGAEADDGDGKQADSTQHSSIHLSEVALKNVGVRTGQVKATTFTKTVSVPAMVVERPGRSQVEITAQVTGTVIRIFPMKGQAIEPGQPLFDLRLTHEDLVTAQRDFLRSAQELDVVKREIARLEGVGEGVVAGQRVLEYKYEQQKTEAGLHAQRQGLLLHGLSDKQIDEILESRQLLQTMTVVAPPFNEKEEHQDLVHQYHIQKINVKRGQHVAAGETLAVLADHCLLYVEGQAFADDARRLIDAAREGWMIDVLPVEDQGDQPTPPKKLKVLFVDDQIDPESRALRFYLSLPNRLVDDGKLRGATFLAWEYRPGQRMDVRIPIGQHWANQIVLPPEAVVDDAAEAFVFEQNGDHFDRIPVAIIYRDKNAVVVENDGTLIGSTVALSGAYQMHLAIQNQAGGGIDPHAGHTH